MPDPYYPQQGQPQYPLAGQEQLPGPWPQPVARPAPRPTERHRNALELTGALGALAGALAVLAAWYIDTQTFVASVSHLNGVCTSGLGSLAQAVRPSLRAHCAEAANLDQLDGYLVIAGVALMAGGTVLAWRHRPAGPR